MDIFQSGSEHASAVERTAFGIEHLQIGLRFQNPAGITLNEICRALACQPGDILIYEDGANE